MSKGTEKLGVVSYPYTHYTQRIIYKLRMAVEERESRLIDQVSVIMHLGFNACMGLHLE